MKKLVIKIEAVKEFTFETNEYYRNLTPEELAKHLEGMKEDIKGLINHEMGNPEELDVLVYVEEVGPDVPKSQ